MKTIAHKISVLALTLFAAGDIFAQQDALVSQYMFNELYLSPAYSGVRKDANITGVFRKQWTGFDGAPVTQTLSYDRKIKENMGLGVLISNDKIGVTGQTDFFADYSYHLKFSDDLKLSLGLRAGVSNYRADLTELVVWDADDASFTRNITGKWLPNCGTGAYLYAPKYYVGISVPRILNYDPATFLHIELDRAPLYERHYYMHGGYKYDINDKIGLHHSLLFKYAPAAPPQFDINTIGYYKKMFGLGFSYRTRSSLVILAEFVARKNIRLGYSFDYSFGELRRYSGGSHEIMISYSFDKGESSASFAQ